MRGIKSGLHAWLASKVSLKFAQESGQGMARRGKNGCHGSLDSVIKATASSQLKR